MARVDETSVHPILPSGARLGSSYRCLAAFAWGTAKEPKPEHREEAKMTVAREIMTGGPEYMKSTDSAKDAASRLESEGIGAIPVCESNGHLTGMVTDRDIAIKVVAAGRDPQETTLGDLAHQSEVVTIGADDSIEEVLETMKRYQVRRLPVIDGDKMVGVISQADIARSLSPEQVGDLVAAISS